MTDILKLENVSYEYNNKSEKVTAVRDVTVSFSNGKLHAITGQSGSGKTTLLSLMAGLDNVSSGNILVNQKSLSDMDKDVYRSFDVGIIFQAFNLLPQLTALENVLLSLEIAKYSSKDRKTVAVEVLKKVGMTEAKMNRKVLKLSGGEQQRIAVARALAPNPKIILADEPTGNLDHDTGTAIIDLLLDIAHKENKIVIMITHSRNIANRCDKIYGMKDGILLPIKVS
ncbi:ABC transporter ATP-binding protein [Vallitalea sediminicola]